MLKTDAPKWIFRSEGSGAFEACKVISRLVNRSLETTTILIATLVEWLYTLAAGTGNLTTDGQSEGAYAEDRKKTEEVSEQEDPVARIDLFHQLLKPTLKFEISLKINFRVYSLRLK